MSDDPYVEGDRVSWKVPLSPGAKPTIMLGTIGEPREDGQVNVIPDIGGPSKSWVIDPRSLSRVQEE